MIKTRVQTQGFIGRETAASVAEQASLLNNTVHVRNGRPPRESCGAFAVARQLYREEGSAVFFRGLGVCSARAFVVNSVQVCLLACLLEGRLEY